MVNFSIIEEKAEESTMLVNSNSSKKKRKKLMKSKSESKSEEFKYSMIKSLQHPQFQISN